MAKQLWLNNFDTELIGAVKALPDTGTPATELGYGIIQLSGAMATVLPSITGGDWFLLTLFKLSGGLETDMEIVKVTNIDTSSGSETRLTVLRGQEGTTIRAYAIADKVSMRMTAGTAQNFAQKSMNLGDLPDAAAARSNIGAEPTIAADADTKYWRGNKTWSDFAADVRATVLTGLSTATNAAIAATDSVLVALGKIQKQITDHFGSGGTAHANAVAGGAAGFMSGADKTKLNGIATGATANSADATLLDRANHTGTQAISTVSGLQATLDAKVGGNTTNNLGYLNIPQVSQSAAYTCVLTDNGKHLLHPSADTTARTFTIPANASVAFPVGAAITFINQNGGGVITIAITTDTMRLAGAGTTGSRSLAANGIATAVKVTATEWLISGVGLT